MIRLRTGKRGACLISIGVVWFLTGIGMLLQKPEVVPGYYLLSNFYDIRAAGWIISGLIAFAFAWKPQGVDWPGWTALMIMAVWRCLAYFQGAFHAIITQDGDWRGLIGGLGYIAIATLLRITASWKEPDHTLEEKRDEQ